MNKRFILIFVVALMICIHKLFFINQPLVTAQIKKIANQNQRSLASVNKSLNTKSPKQETINHEKNKNDSDVFQRLEQCYAQLKKENYFNSEILLNVLQKQNSRSLEMLNINWENFYKEPIHKESSQIFRFYQAIDKAGLLHGSFKNHSLENYRQGVSELKNIISEDPQNYYPYLFLAFIYINEKKIKKAQKILAEMDTNATYYDNFYSTWASELLQDASQSVWSYWQAGETYSSMPIPDLKILNDLQKYDYDKKRLSQAIKDFYLKFQTNSITKQLHAPLIDYMYALKIVQAPKSYSKIAKSIYEKKNMYVAEPYYAKFPLICNAKNVENWFETVRDQL